ncbi:PREDICTED: regucalcin-like isoform X1 [Papilio polytes]|uniref:regucalcin-like isoform X1 n=2 Tax=Papilio polytes TaxID=76194 RepID=UPI00067651E1|nr:PREDICTED: regucalcin-like isoform X1 [Papilio polytes]
MACLDKTTMAVSVQKITEPLLIGEGPHWDEDTQALYFVGTNEQTIHKWVLETGVHTKTMLHGRVGFIIPVEGVANQFVVGVEHKFLIIYWDGEEGSDVDIIKELGEIDQDAPNTFLNDGKADPRGRLFAGTMCDMGPGVEFIPEKGAFYRLDDRGITQLCDKITISNGLAWDLQEKAFYYINTVENKIRRYDYDVETGEISNQRHIFDCKKNKMTGGPDGMTIDTEGYLWVALFNGSAVIKVDPKIGTVVNKVAIPAEQVTSVTFGGPNLDILFVTTASFNLVTEQKPPCGATFMVTGLGAKGHPNVKFKLR